MKVITEGHKYSLQNFESKEEIQTIQFIEKVPAIQINSVTQTPDRLITLNDGTTNEEVIEMLIDKILIIITQFCQNVNKLL